MSSVAANSVTFLGAPFDLVTAPDVIETIRQRRSGQPFRYVVTPNVDHVVRLSRQPELRTAYDGAWLRLCDSHPVRFLGRLIGLDLPHFTGADLTARIFGEVIEPGDEIAVLGSSEEIIGELRQRYPQLHITAHVPPMGFAGDARAFAEAVRFAVESKARFLFLAVGSPQSEKVAEAIAAVPGATGTAFCIGASIEFLLGRKQRAPKIMRDLGLEWIHRFASEPGRLWRRYVLGVTPLLMLFAGELIAGRAAARARPAPTPAAPVAAVAAVATASRRPLVLHITGDYPDPVRAPTTEAVKRLIDNAAEADHVVFSLDRKANPLATYLTEVPAPPGQRHFAYGDFGLPLGIGLFARFWLVSRQIRKVLAREGLKPDLVHAHRLTFDGIAGWLISRRLGIPLLVSVRGEVESKVFRFKPLYRRLMRSIVEDAARIYYVSAWYRPSLERLTGADPLRSRLLPNVVRNARPSIEGSLPEPALITVANLDIWRKKGVNRLIEAFARVAQDMPGVRLDIVGGGKPESIEAVRGMIDRAGISDRVRLLGAMRNCELIERLPTYLALALPSRNETFGMVYAEALFAGVPILYSERTGIDGYLDGLDVGIGVDPNDIGQIATALSRLVAENVRWRGNISAAAGELSLRFCPVRQSALYHADIAALARTSIARRPGDWHVSVHSDWRPLEIEWRQLEEQGALTAFQRYDWIAPWYASTLGRGRAEPVIVVVREAAGTAPIMILPLARYASHGVRTIGFADIRISDYAAPVMLKGLALSPAEFRELFRRIAKALPVADLLHLRKLVPEQSGIANPMLSVGRHAPHLFMTHAVPLASSWREIASDRLGRKFVTDMQRKRRALEGIGPVRLEVQRGPDAAGLFEAMCRQHAARFGALGRDDVLADPVWLDHYRSLMSGDHARPLAVMLALHAGEELMATAYGIMHDQRFLMLVMSFEGGRCDKASPGLQLVSEGLAWAAAEGLEAYDLTVGDEPYKRFFKPVSHPVYEIMRALSWRGLGPALAWQAKVRLRRHPRLRAAMKRLLGRA